MEQHKSVPQFAPDDPTDGRALLDWKSRYPPDVLKHIRNEAIYLVVLLFLCPVLLLIIWLVRDHPILGLAPRLRRIIWLYGTGWIAGMLGGTLFDLKWLYHSVARQIWNQDRKLWRLLTPHISGGLSFGMLALVTSGLLGVFDKSAMQGGSAVVGFCFIVGYFSDSAIGKLSEVAATLLGSRTQNSVSNKP